MELLSLMLAMFTSADTWNLALTAAFAILGTFVSIVGYFIKQRMEIYDKHLEECNARAVVTARAEERLKAVEQEVVETRKAVRWLGSCMLVLGAKLGVELPERPLG